MAKKIIERRFSDLGGDNEFIPKKEFRCGKCHNLFKPTKHYQMFCSEDCENIVVQVQNSIESAKLDCICAHCGLEFRKRSYHGAKRKFCGACDHQEKYLDRQLQQKENPETVPKKPRRKISYDQLNKMAEYKRVFDDSGWSHFLKGRKWDRI